MHRHEFPASFFLPLSPTFSISSGNKKSDHKKQKQEDGENFFSPRCDFINSHRDFISSHRGFISSHRGFMNTLKHARKDIKTKGKRLPEGKRKPPAPAVEKELRSQTTAPETNTEICFGSRRCFRYFINW